MPRKNKRVRSDLSTFKPERRKVDKNENCVYIGKENMEKWTYLKTKYKFLSDTEFTSYLLDLFTREKCSFPNKCLPKEISKTVSNAEDISEPTQLGLVTFPLKNNINIIESSSVIVMNTSATVKNDSPVEGEVLLSSGQGTCSTVNVESTANTKVNESTADKFNQENVTSASTTITDVPSIPVLNRVDDTMKQDLDPEINKAKCFSIEKHENDECQNLKLSSIVKSTDNKKIKPKKQKKKKGSNFQEKDNPATSKELNFKHRKRKFKSQTERVDTVCSEEVIVPLCLLADPEANACERVAIPVKLCSGCDLPHGQEVCPLRQPNSVVEDATSLTDWLAGTRRQTFAEASLPPCLELRESRVVARQPIAPFTQLGPLVGAVVKENQIPDDSSMEHIWELFDGSSCRYLSTSDANNSNWLRFLRPASIRSSRSVTAVLLDERLVFVTTTSLNPGDELLFWTENTNPAWAHKKLSRTKCGGCNLSFSHCLYYRLHCSVFHDPAYSLTVRKYHCKVCGLSVLGKENIVKHAAVSHNGKGAYQCQFCHKFFLRLNYLEMHRWYGCSANPNRSRPLCDYCGQEFCQPQKLKVHIKRMHSDMPEVLREFQCQHCHKLLGSRVALQRHTKEVHRKDVVGASTCDRCGKMFQNKSNLKIHMLTHSGVKPFKCAEGECSAAFTTKQCLQSHYRRVHGVPAAAMPQIQRSVEYTFDAYAGSEAVRRPNSVHTESQTSSDGEDTPDKYPTDEPSQLSPPISVISEHVETAPIEAALKPVVSKGSKKWMGETVENTKTVFDFEEDEKEQDINVSQIEDEPVPMLFHKPDSTNASLLVEAALDAAERDIDIPSQTPSHVPLVTSKEPQYPVLRAHSPLGLSRPVSPSEYIIPDQSQSPQLPMESCYSTSMSPRHPYSLMFPERTPHYDFRLSPPPTQMDTFHLDEMRYDLHHRREDSGDESVNVVQNLSLGLKNKPLQLEIPYKYDGLDERNFESVEGLDMSRSGYHHSFVSVTPRYPHALYEPRSYSHTDVLRVVNFSHSVDLSLPRSHHQLTPPISQTMIEPIRILSPPPYQPAYPPLPTSPYGRAPHSPTPYHYNTTY